MSEIITFDYSKLQGRIREKRGSQKELAPEIAISRTALSQKLNNASDFTSREIVNICNALDISYTEIPTYFFRREVQKRERTV